MKDLKDSVKQLKAREAKYAQESNMCFYAKRNINPGEELTVTYGKDWFYSRGAQTK